LGWGSAWAGSPLGREVSGVAEIGFAIRDGATRLAHLYQHDPMRVLFPAPEAGNAILAVLVTTSGGLVAGDRIRIAVRLDAGALAQVTASAAEKIYRSTGATTAIAQDFSVDAATPRLRWRRAPGSSAAGSSCSAGARAASASPTACCTKSGR
jgi:urease accessory protein UreH